MVRYDLEQYWYVVQMFNKQLPEARPGFLTNTVLPYINNGMHHRTRTALLRFVQLEAAKCG